LFAELGIELHRLNVVIYFQYIRIPYDRDGVDLKEQQIGLVVGPIL